MTTHEQNINNLLEIHAQDRQAHFNTDVKSAISFFDESYVYVRDGKIHHLSPAELAPMFTNYFKGAAFQEWDDLEPPIIHISGDGGMAWVVEHFRIRATRQEDDQPIEQISEYAGLTVYEKIEGKWLRVANSSTFARQ